MVVHLVLLKPRPDLSQAERQALVRAFERAIRAIPTVRGVRVGERIRHGARYEAEAPVSVDYGVILEFDDLEGLQAYLRHPAHQELGTRFNQSLSSAMVYDFEAGGIDALDRLI